jgi:membrane-associated phospholipid phosphatase
MTIISAFYLGTKLRWILLVWGSSVISATVYLRYHYVIDVIAGAAIALIIMGAMLYWEKLNLEESNLLRRFLGSKISGFKTIKKY